MNNFPVHSITNETSPGIQISHYKKDGIPIDEKKVLDAHRDDYYIFFILEKNSRRMMVDFNEIELSASMLYYILPTEVHHRIQNENSEGWSIAVDTELVLPECRDAFEGGLWVRQPYLLNESQLSQCHALMQLLYEKYHEDSVDPFRTTVIRSLLQSFLAIAAGCYSEFSGASIKASRPVELTKQFKRLLAAEARSLKSPALFAARLNVTEGYLNEAIKKTTGFPVSYWIHENMMMEAKRLLYYTQLNVKEIAHTLGYEDHSYFSRLFRKVTGTSAIAFRELYHR